MDIQNVSVTSYLKTTLYLLLNRTCGSGDSTP